MQQSYETRRLALQAALDRQKDPAERNRLGQFATPPALAREIVAYGLRLLPSGAPIRFLDPAIGTGAFYTALREMALFQSISQAEGFEFDPHYGRPAQELWAKTPLQIHLADFTKATPLAADSARFNLIICNPPYVRHHHILNGEKIRLQAATELACGVRIGGLAGLYCYFLGLAHPWLAEGGTAGWLIPSEFMDVNYGRAVKQYLLDQVTLLRIHRFDPNEVQFGDALVSSAVVWFRKAPPPPNHTVEFTFGGSLATPQVSRSVVTAALRDESKWTRFPVADIRPSEPVITLGDLFTIKRGLATGDNDFFILSQEKITAYGLPMEHFRPILPSPRYLDIVEIQAAADGSPVIERRLFLLDCRLPEAEVRANHPALWQYLKTGIPEVAERYLCRHRNPWYAQENRPPAPLLCTYLGRNGTRKGRPFRFILNHSQATAPNVYLLLYPRRLLAEALLHEPGLLRRFWEGLNRIHPETFLEEGRVYGGGLYKLEPGELANIPVGPLLAQIPGVDMFLPGR